MCNNQIMNAGGARTHGNAAPLTARTARTVRAADPMADVHPNNPTCHYTQPASQYMQETPNGVPYQVLPDSTMPISVQPNGPGTSLVGAGALQTPLANLPSPAQAVTPIALQDQTTVLQESLPESLTNPAYVPGFLREHIGDLVRVEFLITDSTTDRVGVLKEVGASYIVLDSLDGSSSLMCDLFSIRFVTIMQQTTQNVLAADTIYTSNRFQG